MTKLEKLKNEIGYTKESKQCQNCFYYKSDIITGIGWNKQYS